MRAQNVARRSSSGPKPSTSFMDEYWSSPREAPLSESETPTLSASETLSFMSNYWSGKSGSISAGTNDELARTKPETTDSSSVVDSSEATTSSSASRSEAFSSSPDTSPTVKAKHPSEPKPSTSFMDEYWSSPRDAPLSKSETPTLSASSTFSFMSNYWSGKSGSISAGGNDELSQSSSGVPSKVVESKMMSESESQDKTRVQTSSNNDSVTSFMNSYWSEEILTDEEQILPAASTDIQSDPVELFRNVESFQSEQQDTPSQTDEGIAINIKTDESNESSLDDSDGFRDSGVDGYVAENEKVVSESYSMKIPYFAQATPGVDEVASPASESGIGSSMNPNKTPQSNSDMSSWSKINGPLPDSSADDIKADSFGGRVSPYPTPKSKSRGSIIDAEVESSDSYQDMAEVFNKSRVDKNGLSAPSRSNAASSIQSGTFNGDSDTTDRIDNNSQFPSASSLSTNENREDKKTQTNLTGIGFKDLAEASGTSSQVSFSIPSFSMGKIVQASGDTAEEKQKIPCFGAAPMMGGPLFFGENYWNKLTMDLGDENTGVFIRAAELKHGRVAMLATVGFALQKFRITVSVGILFSFGLQELGFSYI